MFKSCSRNQSSSCRLALLFVFFCCCMMGSLGILNNTNSVKIGVMVDLNSTIGQLADAAIQLAVQDVNNARNILNETQLVLELSNYACTPLQGAASAVELIKQEVVGVVGPQCSSVAQFASHIGNQAHVPFVSFAATDPNLSEMQYPYFIRTAPSDAIQMEAVAAFIVYHKWREVVILHMDDDYGANGASALSDSLQRRGSKIVQKVPLVPWTDKTSIGNELTKLADMQTRVFVLHTHPDIGLQVLAEAKFLNMLDIGYVWIATDFLASNLEDGSLSSEMVNSIQGIIGMRRYIAPSPGLRHLAMDLGYMDPTQINAYATYAYDAVWTMVLAASAYLKQKSTFNFTPATRLPQESASDCDLLHIQTFEGGAAIRDIILQTKYEGMSGIIEFDKAGDVVNTSFEYINMVGKSAHVVGYWTKETGVSRFLFKRIDPANPVKLPIIWLGDTTDIPQGWVIPKNGRPLRIGIPRKEGYTELVSQTTGPDNTTIYNGFCIQVFEEALKYLPYAVPHYYVPFGNGSSTPIYDDLIRNLANQEYDAVVGDVAILPDRLKLVDFTQPYIESGLIVLVPLKDKRVENPWAFLRPFTTAMWCTVLSFFLFTGAVIWMLEYRVNEDFQGSPQKQAIVMLSFIFSTLFFAHKEDTRSFLGRIVLLVWLFVILIINSSYTANLTSILTVEQLTPTIQGLDSLLKSNMTIGYQTGSFVHDYLIRLGGNPTRLRALESREMYQEALDKGPNGGGVAAIVDELPYIQLFRVSHCDNYTIVGQEFTKSGWGFQAFPQGSDIVPDLSQAILQMSQSGQLAKIREFWFNEHACDHTSTTAQSNQLGLKSFGGLFLLSAVASILCLIIHITRLVLMYKQHRIQHGSMPQHYTEHIKQFAEFAAQPKEKKRPVNHSTQKVEQFLTDSNSIAVSAPTRALTSGSYHNDPHH